jgi:hypothetical protein
MSTSHKSIETSAKVMLRELRDAQISPSTFFCVFCVVNNWSDPRWPRVYKFRVCVVNHHGLDVYQSLANAVQSALSYEPHPPV